ncbi:MAG: histidine kinase, partial [Oscillospiraceae bacterium]|nr:histidine kinase [Oscillospiraceae bacterium]
MRNERINKEKSILGAINDLNNRLVLMLVIPMIISIGLMLFYASQYNSAIRRMEEITELKTIVSEQIPEKAWGIVSGRDSLPGSDIYVVIHEVEDRVDKVTGETSEENMLSLIVARRTMETLENYVDELRDNVRDGAPVVENEKVLEEVRNVAVLVDSMFSDYIELEITSTAKMNQTLSIVVIITALVEIVIVLSAVMARNISMRSTANMVRKPIEKLEEVTGVLADGTLNARIPETDVTELRNLTMQVNTMADHLENMMIRSEKDAKKLRKAELRTLQAQINPHFLYNTLDAIIWKAEGGDMEEVINLTSSLSDFFRISLSSGADWIPVSQEKKHIEGYLKIQKTRYRDILRYEIDIPDELGEYCILKLLLQPLVENAIYHGIKIKRGGGLIRVSCREDNGFLEFSVKDTGCGMSPEKLDELNKKIKAGKPTVSEGGGGGFGLVNVNMRIRLYYNEPEGLKIMSSPEGTEVRFRVPCKTKEEIFEDE